MVSLAPHLHTCRHAPSHGPSEVSGHLLLDPRRDRLPRPSPALVQVFDISGLCPTITKNRGQNNKKK